MLIYLDNCCFNRPFDNQKQIRIRIETEAKLFIQEEILPGKFLLAWTYILDYENASKPKMLCTLPVLLLWNVNILLLPTFTSLKNWLILKKSWE